jgi:hypothetical protein
VADNAVFMTKLNLYKHSKPIELAAQSWSEPSGNSGIPSRRPIGQEAHHDPLIYAFITLLLTTTTLFINPLLFPL